MSRQKPLVVRHGITTYDRDLVKAIDNTTYADSYFNIQFRTQDTKDAWHSGQWGIKQGDPLNRLPNELFFTVDPNATGASQGWTGIHETTREQAEGKNVVYYLMDASGNRIEPFYPVRNQNQGLHIGCQKFKPFFVSYF